MSKRIRLGTRGSALALIQAKQVQEELIHFYPDETIEIVPISTKGDTDKVTPLNLIGGKGVFVKELEQALLDNQIDIAIHSLKDVTTDLHPNLVLSGFLKPEAITDSFISSKNITLKDLPKASRVGTGSMRRKALLHRLRPDIEVLPLRGNVETRLKKCNEDGYDAIILSTAGLIRLGLESSITEELNPCEFTPAPGQGVIALECRKDDSSSLCYSKKISDPEQSRLSNFEYDIINRLNLHCGYPYGSYTRLENNKWVVDIFFMTSDLSGCLKKCYEAPVDKLESLIDPICSDLSAVMNKS
jgi:hydroxymethylbilane synthase